MRSKYFTREFDKVVGVRDGRFGVRVHVGLHLPYAVVGHRAREVMVELGLRHKLPLVGSDGAEGVLYLLRGSHLSFYQAEICLCGRDKCNNADPVPEVCSLILALKKDDFNQIEMI